MYALFHTSLTTIFSGKYAAANARVDELVGLAEEKDAAFWRAGGMMHRGCVLALTGKAADAVQMITTRNHGNAVDGSNDVYATVLVILGESLCGTWSIR